MLIDNTGNKIEGEGQWNRHELGGTKRHVWRKIHIGIVVKTREAGAAEFTTSNVGDAPPVTEAVV